MSFEKELKSACTRTQQRVNIACRKVAMEAFKRVVYRTPVDTGALRANWQVTVGNLSYETTDATDKDGFATIKRGETEIAKWNPGEAAVFLANHLVYAIPIEYGGSPVKSPEGMVRVTISELTSQ